MASWESYDNDPKRDPMPKANTGKEHLQTGQFGKSSLGSNISQAHTDFYSRGGNHPASFSVPFAHNQGMANMHATSQKPVNKVTAKLVSKPATKSSKPAAMGGGHAKPSMPVLGGNSAGKAPSKRGGKAPAKGRAKKMKLGVSKHAGNLARVLTQMTGNK